MTAEHARLDARTRAVLFSLPLLGGCGAETPATDREGTPWFEDVTQQSGLSFEHRSGHGERYYMPEIMGGGAALFDMDEDGDLDLYLVQSGDLRTRDATAGANRLYRNLGPGTFEDVTKESGADDSGYGMGVACGDVDEDGDTDLYVTNVGPNALLRNQGHGVFRDATLEAGGGHAGWGTSAAFLDANRDGRLDLFVTNYLDWSMETELPCMDPQGRPDYCSPKNYRTPARDVFYLSTDQGLVDTSKSSGVEELPGTGLGVGCADFDGDGWEDVFVANDGMPDHLWRNRGDGTFENVATLWGCATDSNGLNKAGMGVTIADIDDDQDPDVLVCNLAGETDSLFLNQGGFFGDRTASAGLGSVSKPYTRFGMGWVDFDNDGHLDLFQANGRVQRADGTIDGDPYAEENLLFRGGPEQRFDEVRPRGGTRTSLVATSRGAAFGDIDGDGAPDVVVVNRDGPVHVLRNVAGGERSWILFSVREASGGNALGAAVDLRIGDRWIRREVRAAYSYLSSNDPRIHVGLGDASRVDEIEICWVDGSRERFGARGANQEHTLQRGAGEAVPADAPPPPRAPLRD